MEIPRFMAIITANTEAKTEAAPLIPQSPDAKDSNRRLDKLIPSGNAIPIKNPVGIRIPAETAIRIAAVWETNAFNRRGRNNPNEEMIARSKRRQMNA